MTTFDQILPKAIEILERHKDRLSSVGPIIINRDLNGRVRLIVDAALHSNDEAKLLLKNLTQELREALGPHGSPESSFVLFEENLDKVIGDDPVFSLKEIPSVKVIDRLTTEGTWSSLASSSPPPSCHRLVFYSVKGGVGRSTALAVSAWTLAQAGKRVLVMDLDLESPGLSSAILPAVRQSQFGIVDWLLEDLLNNTQPVFDDMVSKSDLSRDGDIFVVPAHGRNPGEYISKLGRIFMPKLLEDGRREPWNCRLSRLVGQLEQQWNPDVILIDSRAGIDEIASGCVTGLEASLVLLFASDSTQTWTNYRILFDHWGRMGLIERIREKLQVVGAMLPDTGTKEYFSGLRENACNLFTQTMYDEVPPGEISGDRWNFEEFDELAPHYPWAIRWHRGFSMLTSLHDRLEKIDRNEVDLVFKSLLDNIFSHISSPLTEPSNG